MHTNELTKLIPLRFFHVHPLRMALDDHTAERLTPEARRAMLRAFGDRMLLKVTSMDDPEDMPGVERAVRVAAVIERLYSRCDRAEVQAPDPRKLEAERANNAVEAIKARVALADNYRWGESRRQDLQKWWEPAQAMTQGQPQSLPQISPQAAAQPAKEVMADVAEPVAAEVVRQDAPEETPEATSVRSVDVTETAPETITSQDAPVAPSVDHDATLRETWARLGLPDITEDELEKFAKLRQKPPPPP